MKNKYIGVLPEGKNPLSGNRTNGNLNLIFELKEDGFYHGKTGVFTKEQITLDLKNGFLREVV